ncbi:hypothetical protein GCM10011352_00680 [Marinobacterium zhoushanense]|uniref:Uncharacterized protein n=1 Tax=Marinobacterium zhoushanense TaxID=1679163 RepID=A0ABQ1JZE2_9GAMM|nr:hypothetical protein GCM10011352_00680 [Marinobacterium zhoushanense]
MPNGFMDRRGEKANRAGGVFGNCLHQCSGPIYCYSGESAEPDNATRVPVLNYRDEILSFITR